MVDKAVIKRRIKRAIGRKRLFLQHLCLDKGYNYAKEEQELIKRGYVMHIPIKKKKKKGGYKVGKEKPIEATPYRKKYSPKRWVIERTNS